jgi:hypothetical protein
MAIGPGLRAIRALASIQTLERFRAKFQTLDVFKLMYSLTNHKDWLIPTRNPCLYPILVVIRSQFNPLFCMAIGPGLRAISTFTSLQTLERFRAKLQTLDVFKLMYSLTNHKDWLIPTRNPCLYPILVVIRSQFNPLFCMAIGPGLRAISTLTSLQTLEGFRAKLQTLDVFKLNIWSRLRFSLCEKSNKLQ